MRFYVVKVRRIGTLREYEFHFYRKNETEAKAFAKHRLARYAEKIAAPTYWAYIESGVEVFEILSCEERNPVTEALVKMPVIAGPLMFNGKPDKPLLPWQHGAHIDSLPKNE